MVRGGAGPVWPASVEVVPAAYLAATLTTHVFGSASDEATREDGATADGRPSRSKTRPTFLVVGGVHGNEGCSMLGVEALSQYLRAASGKLARHLLGHARVVCVPCANRVGMLCAGTRLPGPETPMEAWGARCCPTNTAPAVTVAFGEGRVWGVPAAHKGSDPLEGWADPNRGWRGNRTFVKGHLERLIADFEPDLCLFSHDWAPTKVLIRPWRERHVKDEAMIGDGRGQRVGGDALPSSTAPLSPSPFPCFF